jgi:hypothetical protein
MQGGFKRTLRLGILAACLPLLAWPQVSKPLEFSHFGQPDAGRTKAELRHLLEAYPPSLALILGSDPTLLGNQTFLAPYPALVSYLSAHPEIAHNPSFYIDAPGYRRPPDYATQALNMWMDVLTGIAVLIGFGMGIGLLTWLIRTLADYRRWNRLTKIQTEFHTKLLDRFTANDELLAYIQSPAGSKFLQSTPIALDAGPRSAGAPFGRVLWSVQGGVVLVAAGIGLTAVSRTVRSQASEPLWALGILGLAVGAGFIISAIISFVLSNRLGLIERQARSDERV